MNHHMAVLFFLYSLYKEPGNIVFTQRSEIYLPLANTAIKPSVIAEIVATS